jgi:peptidoglycan LD-endopeptidase CwlK
MASRDIKRLTSTMQTAAAHVEAALAAQGIGLVIHCTLRTCAEQAAEFAKTRNKVDIAVKADDLRKRGFDFLAEILEAAPVGRRRSDGTHATNAGPGESWHQYMAAWDAVLTRNGKPLWKGSEPEWKVYFKAIQEVGLYRLSFEAGHAQQMPAKTNPLRIYSPDEVRQQLQQAGAL